MKSINHKLAVGVLLGLASGQAAYANPNGAQVVNGQVNIAHPNANTLAITNSNGAIINWQQFSIQQNEITRFIQGSANSAILNRVIGQDPSAILGQLLSNGRVFLINENGIVIGSGATVNTPEQRCRRSRKCVSESRHRKGIRGQQTKPNQR